MGSVTFGAAWSLRDVVVVQVVFVHFDVVPFVVVAVVSQVSVARRVVVQVAVVVVEVGAVQLFDAQLFAVVVLLLVVSDDLAPTVAIFAARYVFPLPFFLDIRQVVFFLLQIALLWPK